MTKNKFNLLLITGIFTLSIFLGSSNLYEKKRKNIKETIQANIEGKGTTFEFTLLSGNKHNHPTFAFWIEDLNGNFIQELFVTKSLSTGIYGHGQKRKDVWSLHEGEARRPATLPYFLHKRGVKAPDGTYLPTPDNPIVDAFSGATPKSDFKLNTKSNELLTGKYRVLFEVNQPWDWNEFWYNTKYPDDFDYKTSCQPAIVYAVIVDFDNLMDYYSLNPIGHSHYSGKTGELFTDLSTLTTAKHIFNKIELRVK